MALIKNFISVKTKSGAVCDDSQAMKFIMLAKSRRLNPWEGDCYLIGFDGKDGPQFSLVTAHQAFLKRAEVHPEFDGMISGVVVKEKDGTLRDLEGDFLLAEQTLVGGWAKVFFKTRKYPMFKKLSLATFRKPFGVWNSDPAGMIVKCAEADALRSSFPTMMGGMHLQQEIESTMSAVVHDRRPVFDPPDAPAQLPPPSEPAKSTNPYSKPTTARKKAPPSDGDLGPVDPSTKAGTDVPATPTTQSPPPPVHVVSEQADLPHVQLSEFLSENGIPFDDLRDFFSANGLIEDAGSIATLEEIPVAAITKLMGDARLITSLVRTCGKK